MALIVEDGSGVAGAESLCSVATADTYHSNRSNAAWALLTIAVKESSLRKATDYMVQVYSMQWKGYRVSSTQALDWPRDVVDLPANMSSGASYYYVPNDEVPQAVQFACAELALKASTDDLLADLDQQVRSETIGPISTEYDNTSPQYKRYSAVYAMLKPYLVGGSGMMRLVRT